MIELLGSYLDVLGERMATGQMAPQFAWPVDGILVQADGTSSFLIGATSDELQYTQK